MIGRQVSLKTVLQIIYHLQTTEFLFLQMTFFSEHYNNDVLDAYKEATYLTKTNRFLTVEHAEVVQLHWAAASANSVKVMVEPMSCNAKLPHCTWSHFRSHHELRPLDYKSFWVWRQFLLVILLKTHGFLKFRVCWKFRKRVFCCRLCFSPWRFTAINLKINTNKIPYDSHNDWNELILFKISILSQPA